jgi:5'-3' exonuclease
MEMKSHGHIQWPASQPVDPHTLLLMVLPEYSAGLMAASVASAVRAGDGQLSVFFPKSYEINLALHTRYYECTPKIPKISVKFADAFVAKCKLTDAEKERARPGELRRWPTENQAN